MNALKSKNTLGYLIKQYGITVCKPTRQTALKEIARNTSDCDNSVRNTILNTFMQAYFLASDKICKYIEQR